MNVFFSGIGKYLNELISGNLNQQSLTAKETLAITPVKIIGDFIFNVGTGLGFTGLGALTIAAGLIGYERSRTGYYLAFEGCVRIFLGLISPLSNAAAIPFCVYDIYSSKTQHAIIPREHNVIVEALQLDEIPLTEDQQIVKIVPSSPSKNGLRFYFENPNSAAIGKNEIENQLEIENKFEI